MPIFKNGKRVYESPPIEEIKAHCEQQVATLWDEVKRFETPQLLCGFVPETIDIKLKLVKESAGKE